MELIVAPPQVAIRFRVSLIHSIMTTIGLLYVGHRLEGLSDWLRQAEARLTPQTARQLDFAAMFTFLAAGVQGYLVDSVPSDADANPDFETLLRHLNTIDTHALQKVAFLAMRESLVRQKHLEPDQPLPSDREARAELIDLAYQTSASRAEPPFQMPMDGKAFANGLEDAEVLHRRLVQAIQTLWRDVYAQQAIDDIAQHQRAVQFHARQTYPPELRSVFRSVTGRSMPDWLQERATRVREVIFVPASHTGAHFTVSILTDRWWVGYNANLFPADRGNDSYSPELYPALKALADETRLRIVALLTEGEFNVGEIAEALSLTQSTASRHLSLLARTDLLDTRRDGTMRYYALNHSTLLNVSRRLGALARSLPNQGAQQA